MITPAAVDSTGLLPEPEPAEMNLESVLQALGDPVRLQIVRKLHASQSAKACGTFDLPVGKSTASHHFKVLREAGLIRQRVEGRERLSELREDDVEERFPGLLASVLTASSSNSYSSSAIAAAARAAPSRSTGR